MFRSWEVQNRTNFCFLLHCHQRVHSKMFKGGSSKGPATILFFTHWAMVSVRSTPWTKADFAFFAMIPGRNFFNAVSAPLATVLKACLAIFLWWQFQLNQHFCVNLFRTPVFNLVWTRFLARNLGNVFQKQSSGGWLWRQYTAPSLPFCLKSLKKRKM